jgi:molecular chaperone GrpE
MSEDQDRGTETVAETSVHPIMPDEAELGPERDRAEAELAELKDRLLRHQADFDNFRRRTERERAEWAQFAGMEVVRTLLPALDDFDRALRMTAGSAEPGGEFYKGMELVWQRLMSALEKAGLEPVVAAGQPFDPQFHEAIDRAEDPELTEDTVAAEYQRGYRFRGKLLRPALVKVAVKG